MANHNGQLAILSVGVGEGAREDDLAMIVRLTQLDGKLPNLALMKLAHFHRERDDEVRFSKHAERDLLEPEYGKVYGSAIFSMSRDRVQRFREQFPGAIVGGTYNIADNTTVEQVLGIDGEQERYDYSIYPRFDGSIGFTQRGCRLKCGFCVVPKKEGKPRSVNTIAQIWRGEPYPRHVHLLDNDFFGQQRDQWEARIDEIRNGGFRVCLNQGINIRMIDDDAARALASIPYYDDAFKTPRLYTAWDNVGDEARFFKGVDILEYWGVKPYHLTVYMLIGYDKRETWERILYRFEKMVARGIQPYPMVYGERERTIPLGGCNRRIGHKTLADFQRYAIRRLHTLMPFEAYGGAAIPDAAQGDLLEVTEMRTAFEEIGKQAALIRDGAGYSEGERMVAALVVMLTAELGRIYEATGFGGPIHHQPERSRHIEDSERR